MHELSIAQNILDIALSQCRAKGFNVIESISIRVGRASGIMPDALSFAFHAIKLDSIASQASLHIEEVRVTGLCRDCSKTFLVEEEYIICCPLCLGTSFEITAGRELDIIDLEVS